MLRAESCGTDAFSKLPKRTTSSRAANRERIEKVRALTEEKSRREDERNGGKSDEIRGEYDEHMCRKIGNVINKRNKKMH